MAAMMPSDDLWASVRIDLVSEDLGQEANASLQSALEQDAEAIGRLGIVLKKRIHGRRLDEVETLIERPPRQGLVEDEPGMFLADHGEYAEGGERRKLYRLELAGEMAVFFSISLNSGARIE